jgi:hypothetical protein
MEVNLKTFRVITLLVIMASLVLVGCAQTAATADAGLMQTSIAGTLQVMQTQDAAANVSAATTAAEAPTTEPTSAPAATLEPTISVVDVPTAQATINVAEGGTPTGPSYRVGHVTDLNFEDGSFVDVKLSFTKRWTITNVGTATWPADTKLVPVDDNPFSAPDYIYIGQVVSPGQSVTLAVDLKCSEVAATYTGHFMLETPDGKRFGIGSNFDEPFWVKVVCHD